MSVFQDVMTVPFVVIIPVLGMATADAGILAGSLGWAFAKVALFLGMATLSSIIERDLSAMGKWLFIGAIMLLVAGIANFFIQSGVLMITLAALAIGIFSAFILHDLKRVQDGLETNQLRHRHVRRVPEHLQRVPVAAGCVRSGNHPGRVRPRPCSASTATSSWYP